MRTQCLSIVTVCLISLLVASAAAFAANTAPTDPTSIVVTPSPGYRDTNLTAVASGSSDPDGPLPLVYEYSWRKSIDGGVTFGGWTGWSDSGVLDHTANAFAPGQAWQVKARARDGQNKTSGDYVSPTLISILNKPPSSPTSVSVTPPNPTTTDDLKASASGGGDIDGDSLAYNYKWEKWDGAAWVDAGVVGDTVADELTTGGERWRALAQTSAGGQTSDWVASAEVTIANTAPTAPTSVGITPDNPSTTADLTATADGSQDVDGTTPTYQFEWRSNDGTGWSEWGRPGGTILAADTVAGQQWQVRARATDGIDASDWVAMTTWITIANSAPTAPTSVGITPLTPSTTADLTASADGSTDDDGTTPTYEFEWRSDDGTGWSEWGHPGATIPAADTSKGQQWQARARATDGIGTSAWVEMTTSVTILNAAPTKPTTVLISPSVPGKENLTASASGSTDADNDELTFQYQWARVNPAGGYFTNWADNAGQVLTADKVNFGQTWQVRARAFDGTAYSPWKVHKTATIVRMVTYLTPVADAVNVPLNSYFQITFKWSVNQLSVNQRLRLYKGTSLVAGSAKWIVANQRVRFVPKTALAPNTVYTLRLNSGITCTSGRVLGWSESYNFTTVGPALSTASVGAMTVAAAPTAQGAQVTVNLANAATVRAVVCNIAGRVVAELPERDLPSGVSSLLWNGKSRSGSNVPSGSYLVQVTARGADGAQSTAVTSLSLRR